MRHAGLWLGLTAAAFLGGCAEETETGGGGGTTQPTTSTTGSGGAQGGSGGQVQGGSGGQVQGGSGGEAEGGSGGSGGEPEGGSGGSGGEAEGGAGGGNTGGAPAEDLCNTTLVTEGVYTGSYDDLADDYDPTESGCTGFDADGPDAAYRIAVPAGESLTAILSPDVADASLYVVTDCTDLSSCEVGADDYYAPGRETVHWTNTTGSPVEVQVIADSYEYYTAATGGYELMLNLGDETDCADFLDNDADDAYDCADTTTCGGTNACTAGTGATGTVCDSNTDCLPVGTDPACITWDGWTDGYCSDWCDPTNDDCAGDGVCREYTATVGLCMDGCTAHGDCRTGYVCDYVTSTPDYGCVPSPQACESATAAVIGDNTGNTSTGTNDLWGNCAYDDATEVVFLYTATADGTLSITLASATDQGFSVRTPTCAYADEDSCVDDELGGTNEVGTVTVTNGTEYFIIVEPYEYGEEGAFTLTLSLS